MMKTYNKLVRDKIPQIISADGKHCSTRVLPEEEYEAALKEKLLEEANEFLASGAAEELADVQEVVLALARAKGVSAEQLEQIRLAKAQERGAFDGRILLQDVWEDKK